MLVFNSVPICSVEFIWPSCVQWDAELIYTDQRKQYLLGGRVMLLLIPIGTRSSVMSIQSKQIGHIAERLILTKSSQYRTSTTSSSNRGTDV
jgi:hypothetical protein